MDTTIQKDDLDGILADVWLLLDHAKIIRKIQLEDTTDLTSEEIKTSKENADYFWKEFEKIHSEVDQKILSVIEKVKNG